MCSESGMQNWQMGTKIIRERSEYLFKHQQWTDCSLIVGSGINAKNFKAHKLILSMSSPFFEALCYNSIGLNDEPITISDAQPEVFESVLNYIYSEKFDVENVDMAFKLCYLAKRYMLPYLVEKCSEVIISGLSPSIACKAYEFANAVVEPTLKERSLEFIREQTMDVITDSSIFDIALDTWLNILDCDELKIPNECNLLDSLELWAKKECSRRKLDESPINLTTVVGPALEKFRFLSLTAEEFAKGPGLSPLLRKEVSFSIFMNISDSSSLCPMPSGYCTCTQPRFLKKLKLNFPRSLNNCKIFSAKTVALDFFTDCRVYFNGICVDLASSNSLCSATLQSSHGKELASFAKDDDDKQTNLMFSLVAYKCQPVVRIEPFRKYKIVIVLPEEVKYGYSYQNLENGLKCNKVTFAFQPVPTDGIVWTILFSK